MKLHLVLILPKYTDNHLYIREHSAVSFIVHIKLIWILKSFTLLMNDFYVLHVIHLALNIVSWWVILFLGLLFAGVTKNVQSNYAFPLLLQQICTLHHVSHKMAGDNSNLAYGNRTYLTGEVPLTTCCVLYISS